MAKGQRPSPLPPREQRSGPRVPTPQMIAAAAPWLPPPYERQHVVAWQAIAAGKADEAQQKMALDWLIKIGCMTYEMTYFPGPDGTRNSDFAQGRRSVGLQLVKLLHLNPGLVKATVAQADAHEPKD